MTAAAAPRRAVFILGMHRSGTSAMARVLNLMGVELGHDLNPPREDNERGYWEHARIVSLHERLLRELGSSWHDLTPLPERWWSAERVLPYKKELVELVRRDFGSAPLWGLKDPRLSRLLPLWHSILTDLGVEAGFIVMVRHPGEVAASLGRRKDNSLLPAHSELLWLDYLLSAEENTAGRARVFVTYDDLLADWKGTLAAAARRLDLAWPKTCSEAAFQTEAFLTASLRHHKAGANARLAPLVENAYARVKAAAGSETAMLALADIRDDYWDAAALFRPLVEESRAKLETSTRLFSQNAAQGQVFWGRAGEFAEQRSARFHYVVAQDQELAVEAAIRAGELDGIRIDPMEFPGLLRLDALRIEAEGGELLWEWDGTADALETAGTCSLGRKERGIYLRSWGDDPILLLPGFKAPKGAGRITVRLRMRCTPLTRHGNGASIEAELADALEIESRRYEAERDELARKARGLARDKVEALQKALAARDRELSNIPRLVRRLFRTSGPTLAEKPSHIDAEGIWFSMDALAFKGGQVHGFGWLFHPERKVLALRLKGRSRGAVLSLDCHYGTHRQDVAAEFPAQPNARNCGFFLSGRLEQDACRAAWLEVEYDSHDLCRVDLLAFRKGKRGLGALASAKSLNRARMMLGWAAKAAILLLDGDIGGLVEKIRGKIERARKPSARARLDRHALRRLASGLSGRKARLIIDHNLGGGANLYRERQIKEWTENGIPTLLLYFDLAQLDYRLACPLRDGERTLSLPSLDSLLDLGKAVELDEIWINDLVCFPEPEALAPLIMKIKALSQARLVFAVHDYFMVCPSWTLQDASGTFCGVPSLDRCRECLPKLRQSASVPIPSRDIDRWRSLWGRFLGRATEIRCFSDSSRRLLLRAYPRLPLGKLVVQPHSVDYLPETKPVVNRGAPLNIGIVGHITQLKGADVVERMARRIQTDRLPVRLTVIGTIDKALSADVAQVTGTYRPEDLPVLIERTGANLFFVPSIVPETFSYVIHELMALEVPLAVFDLGAPGEEVARYHQGLVIDKIDADRALGALIRFHEDRAATLMGSR